MRESNSAEAHYRIKPQGISGYVEFAVESRKDLTLGHWITRGTYATIERAESRLRAIMAADKVADAAAQKALEIGIKYYD